MKDEDSVPGKADIALFAAGSAMAGIASLRFFIQFEMERAAVVQAYVARAPEITDKVILTGNDIANRVFMPDFYSGVILGVVAGANVATMAYKLLDYYSKTQQLASGSIQS